MFGMFRAKEVDGELKLAAAEQEKKILRKNVKIKDPRMERFQRLILYNLKTGQSVLTDNNSIGIYTDGKKKMDALLEDIKTAKRYIHLQYYIIRDDEVWRKIERVLLEKARKGVEIRILFDSMGSIRTSHGKWRYLEKNGIATAEFFPVKFRKLPLRLNYRNHRKIVVIDGRVGYLGGFNIGREYLGLMEKFGYWRDTHLRIEGAAVTSLAVRFVLDWDYAAKENLFLRDELFQFPDYRKPGNAALQIISCGPDSGTKQIRNNYLWLIHCAREHIYIQTPYFIPDEPIFTALKIAAGSGVDVRIMVPCKPDHPFVYWATYSYLGKMVRAGAKCYTYENGFLHAKMLCVDGLAVCTGTANMDVRSFGLNFEANAVIYDEKTTKQLETIFFRDMEQSREVTEEIYRNRGTVVRVKERISGWLSPLL